MFRKTKSKTFWIADGPTCSWIFLLAFLGTHQGLMQQQVFPCILAKVPGRHVSLGLPVTRAPGKAPEAPLPSWTPHSDNTGINVAPIVSLMVMLRLKWDPDNLKHSVPVNWKISATFTWIISLNRSKKLLEQVQFSFSCTCLEKWENNEMQVLGFSVRQLTDNIEVFDNY